MCAAVWTYEKEKRLGEFLPTAIFWNWYLLSMNRRVYKFIFEKQTLLCDKLNSIENKYDANVGNLN